MGSRYGGLKQLDPIGPNRETIIDYSVFDAIGAGFGKLVFVIRKGIEDAFKTQIGVRFEDRVAVAYTFQELANLPEGFAVPADRSKPWGTTHAILAAADAIDAPFAVINADDFYGAASYRILANHLSSGSQDAAMVGFELRNTLSDFGSVARGICKVDAGGYLERVVEFTHIERAAAGAVGGAIDTDAAGVPTSFGGHERVSMNMWGFSPDVFPRLQQHFRNFLASHGSDLKSECYIPNAVDALIRAGEMRVRVLATDAGWLGVTYREDRAHVVQGIETHDRRWTLSIEALGMSTAAEAAHAARQFHIPGECISAIPHGSGHINDSYCVVYREDGAIVRYLLQRINGQVFRTRQR